MDLFRLHAYSVWPGRTADDAPTPEGGAVRITPELRTILEANFTAAKFAGQPSVVFVVDEVTRTSDVRDAVMRFAFGEPATARAAAIALAQRLAQAMDRRSTTALFVPAAYQSGPRRQVVLWVFPSEEALRVRRTAEGADIEILKDVFSQRSKLRKAAQFVGREGRTEFLEGRVLDYQASASTNDVATFWIERFLDCALAIKGDAGTRMIARALRDVHDQLEAGDDRDQLHAAAVAVRRTPQRRLSYNAFADRYLEGHLKELFLKSGPPREARAAVFDFNRDAFDRLLHFRVFELEGGIFVSAPLASVGREVRLQGDAQQHLICEGTVVDERMRARHA